MLVNTRRTSLAEDFKILGLDKAILSEAGPRRRRSRNEDVQTSGHGTSYPSPGEEMDTGVRNPNDSGETDPNKATGAKFEGRRGKGRVSALREMDDEDQVEADDDDEQTEDDDRGSESPTVSVPSVSEEDDDEEQIESDDEDETNEGRQARPRTESDDDETQDENDDEDQVEGMPPEVANVEGVRIKLPKGSRKLAESRRYSNECSRRIIKRLSGLKIVESKRKKRAQMIEEHTRKVGLKSGGKNTLAEVRELISSLNRPSSTFDDLCESFSSIANVDESLVVQWAQLEKGYDGATLGKGISFRKLAESALARAHAACKLLSEMEDIGRKKLNSKQVGYLEENIKRLGKEQLLSFHALGDTLASLNKYNRIYDMSGLNEDTEEPLSSDLPHEGSYENPAELGDIPSESRRRGRRARTEGEELPDNTKDRDGGLEFEDIEGLPRDEDDDEELPIEGDDEDEIPTEMDDVDSNPDAEKFAEMDKDELVRECMRMQSEISRGGRRQQREDGRMPTDFVRSSTGESRRPRPRVAPRRRG